jgi:hypothetical protein
MKKLYRVSGVCFVPTECTLWVKAESPEEAVREALARKWQEGVDADSGDDRNAFDWVPFAELASDWKRKPSPIAQAVGCRTCMGTATKDGKPCPRCQ